jgi:phosphoglycerol transferase MdoB-like AlkP superfamily enzyme
MESFATRFTGAVRGHPGITPQFDALAARGAFFMRFFSNGTHTHQGTFATLASFPNQSGHEYLMARHTRAPSRSTPGPMISNGTWNRSTNWRTGRELSFLS